MRFEFTTATHILFGAGVLREVGGLAAEMGACALVVTGSKPQRAAQLMDILREKGIESVTFPISQEPTVDRIGEGLRFARESKCDMVISFGGGSVIDAGKAIATFMTNTGDIFDYLEVIGRGKPITNPPLPFIAIPTTAGTGAEVTRNAVLASPEQRVKVSVRSAMMLARAAVVDPELTYGLPPGVTASTGMDALTQVIEPFVSNAANPLTDALCREGIVRGGHLRAAFESNDSQAREAMAMTSLFGGLALANAKLGAVHGFAGPLGGMFPMPHGEICGCLLPVVMKINVRALGQRQPDGQTLRRYDELARLLTGRANAAAQDGIEYVYTLRDHLCIPMLSDYGVTRADIASIVEKSAQASSMKGNPLVLTTDEMTEILEEVVM
jgi:alcohol dehydrogenase class IV